MLIISDSGIERLRRAHRRVAAATTVAVAEQLTLAGEHAVMFVKAYPQFKPQTGNLQDRTSWRTVKQSNGRILKIRNTAKYATPIDSGARPHVIRAKNAPFLHFFWKKRNRWVRTKQVRHPGNRPYKFLYRAANSAGRFFAVGMQAQINKIARQF